jgi:hypothetical protein
MDAKAVLTDAYKLLDIDNNGLVTITELVNGYLNLIESMQVEIKPEFKESIQYMSEIIRVSSERNEIALPKCNISDLILISVDSFLIESIQ